MQIVSRCKPPNSNVYKTRKELIKLCGTEEGSEGLKQGKDKETIADGGAK